MQYGQQWCSEYGFLQLIFPLFHMAGRALGKDESQTIEKCTEDECQPTQSSITEEIQKSLDGLARRFFYLFEYMLI